MGELHYLLEVSKEDVAAPDGRNSAVWKIYRQASKIDLKQMQCLEPELTKSATLSSEILLLSWYSLNHRNSKRRKTAYVRRLKWFIESFPTSHLSPFLGYDENDEHYVTLKLAWLAQTDLYPNDVHVLNHAATFCANLSPTEAERLWMRTKELDSGTEWNLLLANLQISRAISEREEFARKRFILKCAKLWREYVELTQNCTNQERQHWLFKNISKKLMELAPEVGLRALADEVKSILDRC